MSLHEPVWYDGPDPLTGAPVRLTLRPARIWTCPVHEKPIGLLRRPYELEEELDWHFRAPPKVATGPSACTCGNGAIWIDGPLELLPVRSRLSALSQIMRDHYLPSLKAALTQDIYFGELARAHADLARDQARTKYGGPRVEWSGAPDGGPSESRWRALWRPLSRARTRRRAV